MIPDLEQYIYDTLIAQSALTAIIGTRLSNIYGSRATLTFPYVVYQVVDDQEQDTQRGDGVRCRVEFHIFDVAEGNTNANCRTIISEIRGNAATQANHVPTFGLHRKVIGSLPDGWEAGMMVRTGGTTAHERDVLHYIETYEVTGSIGT